MSQGTYFQNRSLTSRLHDNGIEMCSTHNEGKSVVAEICQSYEDQNLQTYGCAIKKWVHDKLHTIVPKYNNTQ